MGTNKLISMFEKNTLLILFLFLLFNSYGCSLVLNNIDTIEKNQKYAVSWIRQLAGQQFVSLNETGKLQDAEKIVYPKDTKNYNFEMQNKGKHFRIWATPNNYGKTGIISYYFDSTTGNIYGTDKKGKKANRNDPIIESEITNIK